MLDTKADDCNMLSDIFVILWVNIVAVSAASFTVIPFYHIDAFIEYYCDKSRIYTRISYVQTHLLDLQLFIHSSYDVVVRGLTPAPGPPEKMI